MDNLESEILKLKTNVLLSWLNNYRVFKLLISVVEAITLFVPLIEEKFTHGEKEDTELWVSKILKQTNIDHRKLSSKTMQVMLRK